MSNTSFNPDSESVLDRLSKLEAAATPGPWFAEPDGPGTAPTVFEVAYNDPDCEFMALARNHLRALIEVAKAATNPNALRGDLDRALAPLLTTPSEQKEET